MVSTQPPIEPQIGWKKPLMYMIQCHCASISGPVTPLLGDYGESVYGDIWGTTQPVKPARLRLSHGTDFRHITGVLCVSYEKIIEPRELHLEKVSIFDRHDGRQYYFCYKCGCHMFMRLPSFHRSRQEIWTVATGVILNIVGDLDCWTKDAKGRNVYNIPMNAPIGVYNAHSAVASTIDGGLSYWIRTVDKTDLDLLPMSVDAIEGLRLTQNLLFADPLISKEWQEGFSLSVAPSNVEQFRQFRAMFWQQRMDLLVEFSFNPYAYCRSRGLGTPMFVGSGEMIYMFPDDEHDIEADIHHTQQRAIHGEEVLRFSCCCKHVRGHIVRPGCFSGDCKVPYPDLLIPEHLNLGDQVMSNPGGEDWWLRDSTDPDEKAQKRYLAGTCACDACRLTSGFEIGTWAYIPTAAIFVYVDYEEEMETDPRGKGKAKAKEKATKSSEDNDNEKAVPLDLHATPAPLLMCYASSEDILRHFCPVCGATVFCHKTKFPHLTKVSVGLFEAPEGARAEHWLCWYLDRVAFSEEAETGRAGIIARRAEKLILGLRQGMHNWKKNAKGKEKGNGEGKGKTREATRMKNEQPMAGPSGSTRVVEENKKRMETERGVNEAEGGKVELRDGLPVQEDAGGEKTKENSGDRMDTD